MFGSTLEGCEVVDLPFAKKQKKHTHTKKLHFTLKHHCVLDVMVREKKKTKSKNNLKPGAQIMQTDWRI